MSDARIFLLAMTVAVFPGAAFADRASNAFNPRVSLILQGGFADYDSDAEAEVPGVLLGPETELRPSGFALGESELVLEANIDDRFHGWTTVAFENEDGETHVVVEEAYVDTLTLPAGIAVKFGRFFSDIGYLNSVHSHAWDFADAPLAYRALLANRLTDDGLQIRWVAPTALFVEVGAEFLRGGGYPAGGEERDGIGAATFFARTGGDLGTSGAWRFGVSHLDADADGRLTGEDVETAFSGDSRVSLVDFIYKWAPQGNATERSFVFQAEYLFRDESGVLIDDPDAAATRSLYEGEQRGWYAQAVYGFTRGWRAGLRYGEISSDNELGNPTGPRLSELASADEASPRRLTAMVDWSPSEFSRLRLQFSQDKSRDDGETDDQFVLQYIHSLGSHPAHQF